MKKLLVAVLATAMLLGCNVQTKAAPKATNGVSQIVQKIKVGSDGKTVEQRNVSKRLVKDNKIASFKHLYIISPYTGDVLIYSMVKGKVTSGGKRLSPKTVVGVEGQSVGYASMGMKVSVGGSTKRTKEVLGDDGTYGSSVPYIFWFDSKGAYQQHFTGAAIVHISETPLNIKKAIINLD